MSKRQAEMENARTEGGATEHSRKETAAVINRVVHFAGWTDKYFQSLSTVNPVASSHFNFTMPEPTGVVVVVCPDNPPLLGLVSLVLPVIVGGNSVIVLPSQTNRCRP